MSGTPTWTALTFQWITLHYTNGFLSRNTQRTSTFLCYYTICSQHLNQVIKCWISGTVDLGAGLEQIYELAKEPWGLGWELLHWISSSANHELIIKFSKRWINDVREGSSALYDSYCSGKNHKNGFSTHMRNATDTMLICSYIKNALIPASHTRWYKVIQSPRTPSMLMNEKRQWPGGISYLMREVLHRQEKGGTTTLSHNARNLIKQQIHKTHHKLVFASSNKCNSIKNGTQSADLFHRQWLIFLEMKISNHNHFIRLIYCGCTNLDTYGLPAIRLANPQQKPC